MTLNVRSMLFEQKVECCSCNVVLSCHDWSCNVRCSGFWVHWCHAEAIRNVLAHRFSIRIGSGKAGKFLGIGNIAERTTRWCFADEDAGVRWKRRFLCLVTMLLSYLDAGVLQRVSSWMEVYCIKQGWRVGQKLPTALALSLRCSLCLPVSVLIVGWWGRFGQGLAGSRDDITFGQESAVW